MITLLDVNVLVALAWPNHVHHRQARSWFRANHAQGWATCSITENGFVRVSSNPAVVDDEARTPSEAVLLLRRLLQVEGHRFWNDDVSIAATGAVDIDRIRGHRQVMDAHLLALARRHRGCLATFDRKIVDLLPPAEDANRLVRILI